QVHLEVRRWHARLERGEPEAYLRQAGEVSCRPERLGQRWRLGLRLHRNRGAVTPGSPSGARALRALRSSDAPGPPSRPPVAARCPPPLPGDCPRPSGARDLRCAAKPRTAHVAPRRVTYHVRSVPMMSVTRGMLWRLHQAVISVAMRMGVRGS